MIVRFLITEILYVEIFDPDIIDTKIIKIWYWILINTNIRLDPDISDKEIHYSDKTNTGATRYGNAWYLNSDKIDSEIIDSDITDT